MIYIYCCNVHYSLPAFLRKFLIHRFTKRMSFEDVPVSLKICNKSGFLKTLRTKIKLNKSLKTGVPTQMFLTFEKIKRINCKNEGSGSGKSIRILRIRICKIEQDVMHNVRIIVTLSGKACSSPASWLASGRRPL